MIGVIYDRYAVGVDDILLCRRYILPTLRTLTLTCYVALLEKLLETVALGHKATETALVSLYKAARFCRA